MPQRLFYSAVFVLFVGCSSSGDPSNVDDPPSEAVLVPVRAIKAELSDQQSLVLANSDFAFDLYARLRNQEGNLVFSPYNISNGLAMVYAGARGNTEKEVAQCLRLPFGQDCAHAAFHELNRSIHEALKEQGVTLNIANRIWADQSLRIEGAFLDLTRDRYEAALAVVDFAGKRDEVCREMNDWVVEQTKGKIGDIASPSDLPPDTLMVLLCTIYFKGNWASPFWKEFTKQDEFHVSAHETIEVPTMHTSDISQPFRMAITDDAQILELRYNAPPRNGGDFRMVIILPKRNDGLAALERTITTDRLNQWISGLQSGYFEVFLPRFKVASNIDLAPLFRQMGVVRAFERGAADFTGIADGDLYLSQAAHAALINVDEEGTEAAAATKYVVGAFDESKPHVFRADHPFLFLIRHNPTATILFLGRVVNPLGN